jgi:hypothetical protein
VTSRERWLTAIRGLPVDRLPFWPKLSGTYLAHRTGTCAGPSVDDLHGGIGSDRHDWTPLGLRERGWHARSRKTVAS